MARGYGTEQHRHRTFPSVQEVLGFAVMSTAEMPEGHAATLGQHVRSTSPVPDRVLGTSDTATIKRDNVLALVELAF